jgi:hypothetical protein
VEFKSCFEGSHYVTELDISTQMWLELYTEPVPGDPSTWEDEHKLFSKTKAEWEVISAKAELRVHLLRRDVERCIQNEDNGLTYREVTSLLTGEEAHPLITDNKYDAAEDLMFLYSQLSLLYAFILEVRCL